VRQHGAFRVLGWNLVLAVIYTVVARLALALDAVSGFATLVWPPTGLSLAAVLLLGHRVLPGIALGAFAANLWVGAPAPAAVGIAIGNAAEALVGAFALSRFASFRPSLTRVRDSVALIGVAALASTLVSASVGVLSLWLGHVVPSSRASETWLAWWVGDTMGDLIVAPFILTLLWSPTRDQAWREEPSLRLSAVAEGIAVLGLLLATSVLVFTRRSTTGPAAFERAYVVFPFLIWAGLRFGARGAASASFVVASVALAGAIAGGGPFASARLADALLQLQAFMAIVACTTLLMGSASDERREALALRESLISLAAHELKTPLTSLQLRAQKVRRSVQASAPAAEGLARDAEAVERLIKRIARLVDDLLDVSRIMAGKLHLEVQRVNLVALVHEVVERLPESQQSLVTITGPSEPVVGEWDRLRVDQVLSNLVSNAIKYGDQKPVEVVVDCAAGRATLLVRDRGLGIASRDLGRIFERFERAASKNVSGFGVGLWIVRHVARALGGTIRVESRVGVGSTFVVDLPLHSPDSP
jgi:signal transduction histidine kinase